MTDRTTTPCAETLHDCLSQWHLRAPQMLAQSDKGVVYRVTRADGTAAVLKCLSPLGQRAEAHAARALRHWQTHGAVRLIAARNDALLMDHCAGPALLDAPEGQNDAQAIPILCALAKRLHEADAKPPQTVPSLKTRCDVLKAVAPPSAPIKTLFDQARALSLDLLNTAPAPCLLHGDFHHANVMQHVDSTWRVIDPQPLMGDPAYDYANLFGNPLTRPDIILDPERPARLARMISAQTGHAEHRLLAWAFVHSCIAAAWATRDARSADLRTQIARNIARHLAL